jgi:hypothetical protein
MTFKKSLTILTILILTIQGAWALHDTDQFASIFEAARISFDLPTSHDGLIDLDLGSGKLIKRYPNAKPVLGIGIGLVAGGGSMVVGSISISFASVISYSSFPLPNINFGYAAFVVMGIGAGILLAGIPLFAAGIGMIMGNGAIRPRVPLILGIIATSFFIPFIILPIFFSSPLFIAVSAIMGTSLLSLGITFFAIAGKGFNMSYSNVSSIPSGSESEIFLEIDLLRVAL